MIKVYVKKQSNFPVNTGRLKAHLKQVLKNKGIVSDTVLEIGIVGRDKMLELAQSYLGEVGVLHNVLSFPESETRGEFVYPKDFGIRLGEIVLCFPKIVEEAKQENRLIDDKAIELAEHGVYHLLGEHHE